MKKIRPAAALMAMGAGLTAAAQNPAPVNFVVIHLDDMGYGDLTVTGAAGYSTPNIDRLCAEGMRFTNYYAAQPVSSASRAGLLTGCYPNRVGFSGALFPTDSTGINPQEETIAEVLQKKGYVSGAFGKWHVGHFPEFLPLRNGFSEYFGLPYSNDMCPLHITWGGIPPLPMYDGEKVVIDGVTPDDQRYLTTWYTERAVHFIDKNSGGPFFLYLAHSMPHIPLYVSDKFDGKSGQGRYGDVMMEIDWSVGEVMRALRENGVDDNTLVIFTSDNGPWLNYGNHAGSSGGLREGKGTSYDGGLKVPCIMRWPAVVPAGTINNHLASSIDLLPTFAAISGAPLPGLRIDGVSLFPMLRGDFDAKPREYFFYYYGRNNLEGVRNERFKLVLDHRGQSYENHLPGNDGKSGSTSQNVVRSMALYDLRRDPGERYDVRQQYPEVMQELMQVAEQARADLGDDLTGNPGANRRPIGRLGE